MNKIKIAVIDDHTLFRKGLISVLEHYDELNVVFDTDDGNILLANLEKCKPDVVLLDINMPKMNGEELAIKISYQFPQIKTLALSMFDDPDNILKMMEAGINGYLLKDSEPDEILLAIKTVLEKDSYYTHAVVQTIAKIGAAKTTIREVMDNYYLSQNEIQFIQLICKEFTHKEIGKLMSVSERTIDGYRDKLFIKLKIKNKIGLVLFAIKNGIIQV